jgi:L-ascorbate metabolism protein UlaG (beta-lactamase superfamily)
MFRELLAQGMRRLTTPDPRWFRTPHVVAEHDLELAYLGTAGFVLRTGEHTLALDPYVTRAGVAELLRGPLVPDSARVVRYFPQVNDVLVGHAHYDHVLDAPLICQLTGARLIGSRAVCMVGQAAGLPHTQLVSTAGREDIESGPFVVRGLPSRHGKVLLGRVPFPGDITRPPRWPARAWELRHGLVLNWLVRTRSFTLVHVDSADFVREELEGLSADVVCLCAVGRRYRPRYVEEIVRALRPRWVVPCHWDTMITPLDEEPQLLPGVDLPGMFDEIVRAGAEPLLLPLLGRVRF